MKRSSYLKYDEIVELGVRGLKIWAYGRKKKFVCRLEINATGMAVYSGVKGKKKVANVDWEQLIERLAKKRAKAN
ncbi:MAG: hypothetical protein EXR78_10235 [Deltaproteobacteria bacterium]|nr:hypothetical protein [Deltaproteobacteria bacterium]